MNEIPESQSQFTTPDELMRARGARLIEAERMRQRIGEGYSLAHDDAHNKGELLRAAVAYLFALEWEDNGLAKRFAKDFWPWDESAFKRTPEDPVRQLVKAGALLAAEIDRLERAQLGGPKVS